MTWLTRSLRDTSVSGGSRGVPARGSSSSARSDASVRGRLTVRTQQSYLPARSSTGWAGRFRRHPIGPARGRTEAARRKPPFLWLRGGQQLERQSCLPGRAQSHVTWRVAPVESQHVAQSWHGSHTLSTTVDADLLATARRVRARPTRAWSMRRSRRCSPGTAGRRSTPATPLTTLSRWMIQTSGATLPRSGVRPGRRDAAAGSWRGVVVRASGSRPAARRRPDAGRSDPAPSPSARRAVHDDDPRACQRGRPRSWRRSGARALGRQPRRGRERVARCARRSGRSPGRCPHARDLRCARRRRRLSPVT